MFEGYHIDCSRPKLPRIPEGKWLCNGCLKTNSSSGRQTDGPPSAGEHADVVEVALPEALQFMKTQENPEEATENEDGQAMMETLKPLQRTLALAKENIAEAQKKQAAHCAT